MADGHHRLETTLAQKDLPGSHVQERLFVEQCQVVAYRPRSLCPDGVAAVEQLGDQAVVGEVLPRGHREGDGWGPGHDTQQDTGCGGVGGGAAFPRRWGVTWQLAGR